MSIPLPAQAAQRRAGRASYLAGAVFVLVALVLCGGGGAWFAGPATRTGQGTERAVIGMAVFDMHQGDEYWFYEDAGNPWPDSLACAYGSSDDTFTVRRGDKPFAAPETITESGRDYAFFGTMRGERTENVLIACPADRDLGQDSEYVVMPSRAPMWYLLAALAGGITSGVLGLLVVVAATIRHRPGRARGARGRSSPPPGDPLRTRRPSPAWYLAVLPFTLLSLVACVVGLCGGLLTGFVDSLEPPEVGPPRSGGVEDVYSSDRDYLLYFDLSGAAPDAPLSCRLRDTPTGAEGPLRVRTDRPFGVPETITHEGERYQYFGRFRFQESFYGQMICEGESTVLVRHSNQPQLLLATGVGIGFGALLIAAAIGIVLSVRRRR